MKMSRKVQVGIPLLLRHSHSHSHSPLPPLRHSSTTTTKGKRPQAYVSTSHDPWFNLSLEHFLFTTRNSEAPVCLLYRNRPCVVIGRNQNPWKELNAISMNEKGIPFVRRRSGGGTVYHDLGNTNYSFHTSRTSFKRETHSNLIVRALNRFLFPASSSLITTTTKDQKDSRSSNWDLDSLSSGSPHPDGTYVNSRNDICVRIKVLTSASSSLSSSSPSSNSNSNSNSFDFKEMKISGSAYKLISSRAYHHGTMLIKASLNSLGKVLKNDRIGLVSKGVESFRSEVINLSDLFGESSQNHHQYGNENENENVNENENENENEMKVNDFKDFNHEKFVDLVIEEFQNVYGNSKIVEIGEEILEIHNENNQKKIPFEKDEIEIFKEGLKELKSWEWNFGGSPEFTHVLNSRREEKEEGKILTEISTSNPTDLKTFSSTSSTTTATIDSGNLLKIQSFPLKWGEFSLKIKSRNGLIEEIDLIPRIGIHDDSNSDFSSIKEEISSNSSSNENIDVDIESSIHLSELLFILSKLKGKRYDDLGFKCSSGIDFGKNQKEIQTKLKKREKKLREEILFEGSSDEKRNGNGNEKQLRVRGKILNDLLRWFKEAL